MCRREHTVAFIAFVLSGAVRGSSSARTWPGCVTPNFDQLLQFSDAPEISMSVCKRQAKYSLYYLSFCDRKIKTQRKFISFFDIVVINYNLLRHTGVSRIPHFLLIIKKQRCTAFLTVGRNSQESNQHRDDAMCSEQTRSAVLYCKAAPLHQEPLLSLLLQGKLYI